MREQTNLNGVKSVAKALLMLDIHLTDYSPVTNYPISTLFAQDFLVRLFQLLDCEVDLTTQEELYSLRLPELPPLKDLRFCSLKMFPDSYRMTAAKRLRPSSLRFLNWGTMSHGKCLTARILEFPNPERECILSDILLKQLLVSVKCGQITSNINGGSL